ncbi:MAG: hypothetical protein ACF8NJ_02240 [Phycisphaerales bacterium JB038]
MNARPTPRSRQAGRAIRQLDGDQGRILFPDAGAPPLKIRLPRYQARMSDGYGSHMNGKHKLG